VSGKLTWVTVNPGAQSQIGSFHPITEGDWTEGAYISPESEALFAAIAANDVKALQVIIIKLLNCYLMKIFIEMFG
jgi:hypothetical protein